jgi:glycosyltransferase involved in cell wall biosynthesis
MKIGFITVGAYMDQEDYAGNNLLGSESQIFGLSNEFVKKGHEVYIFRRWFESKVEIINNINIISFKSVNSESGLKMTIYKLKFSREVTKYIQKMELDVLVLMDSFTSYFALKLPQPKITITHSEIPIDLIPLEKNSTMNEIKYKFLNLVQRKLFKNSNVIIALNNEFKVYLEKKGYKTVLIPNAINLNMYSTEYSKEKYILFGGRLVKAKRIDDLIKAYSILNEELKNDYKLIIMGFGPEKSNLENLVKSCGLENSIEFIPWDSSKEFIKKILECAVFVLPSQYETFGIVTIEAMALKKPVIASDTYGSIDIIKNGYNGFLFETGNVKKLSEQLQMILEDANLRFKIGINAIKTVEENYTFDKISNEYINLFSELMEI